MSISARHLYQSIQKRPVSALYESICLRVIPRGNNRPNTIFACELLYDALILWPAVNHKPIKTPMTRNNLLLKKLGYLESIIR